ncbi:hypothetical protein L9F63_026992, partial [Diploptera punctata]
AEYGSNNPTHYYTRFNREVLRINKHVNLLKIMVTKAMKTILQDMAKNPERYFSIYTIRVPVHRHSSIV